MYGYIIIFDSHLALIAIISVIQAVDYKEVHTQEEHSLRSLSWHLISDWVRNQAFKHA